MAQFISGDIDAEYNWPICFLCTTRRAGETSVRHCLVDCSDSLGVPVSPLGDARMPWCTLPKTNVTGELLPEQVDEVTESKKCVHASSRNKETCGLGAQFLEAFGYDSASFGVDGPARSQDGDGVCLGH